MLLHPKFLWLRKDQGSKCSEPDNATVQSTQLSEEFLVLCNALGRGAGRRALFYSS